MKDTIIFDLDGTLLNTLDDLTDSINFMLESYEFPLRSLVEIRGFVGNGVKLLVERALGEKLSVLKFNDCFECFTAHYNKNKNNKTAPYPGILEMLKEVKKLGYKTAIVSNKYDAAVQELKRDVFSGLIDEAIGERENLRSKPFPDSTLLAMQMLGVDKENCIYVGDSDVDVATARAAELTFIAVSWGFKDKDFLIDLKPDYIIDSPDELVEILKTIE